VFTRSQGHHDRARARGPRGGSIAVAERCERGAQHRLRALEVAHRGVVVVGEAFLHRQEARDHRGRQRPWRDGVGRQSGLSGDRRGDELLDGLLAGALDGAQVRVAKQHAVAKPCEVVRLAVECALGVDPAADAVEGVALAVGQLGREAFDGQIGGADDDVLPRPSCCEVAAERPPGECWVRRRAGVGRAAGGGSWLRARGSTSPQS
jgi:hypothetical protein